MKKILGREPVLALGLAEATIGAATAFELLNAHQGGALATLVAAGLSFVVRSKVTPVQ